MAKHMKRFSTSLAFRVLRIKTTVSYHYTPVKMAKIKKSYDTKWWWGCRETGSLICRWQEDKMVLWLWKSLALFYEWNMQLSYSPEIAPLDMWPRETKTCVHIKTCTQTFIAALFTMDKNWKWPTQMSFNGWMAKQTVIHPYHKILLRNKKA